MASGLSEQIITRASDVPQAIPQGRNRAVGSGHRSWQNCMVNVCVCVWGVPRRVVSSLSLEGLMLKLEVLPTGRGLGKGFGM